MLLGQVTTQVEVGRQAHRADLGPNTSRRHFPAALGATSAGFDAVLHLADLLAGAGALLADFGTFPAGVLVVGRVHQHEVG